MTDDAGSTRERIIATARHLFGERGYNSVTIREIGAAAGFSPAMVMKVVGSKAELYAAAAPAGPSIEDVRVRDDDRGYELVRRVLDRRTQQVAEPWAMAPFLIQDAPDPDVTRVELRERYLDRIAQFIGDSTAGRTHAGIVVCLLLGLAGGVRTLELLDPSAVGPDPVINRYGAMVQMQIDLCAASADDDSTRPPAQ